MVFSKTSPTGASWKRTSWLTAGASAILGLLLLATWHAGQESAQLDEERLRAELNQLRATVASTQLQLDQQRSKSTNVEVVPKASSPRASSESLGAIRQQLLLAEAKANQYKAILDREQEASISNSRLVRALASPGAHLLPMKGGEVGAEATAYALVVENSRVVFVGSHLPKLASGRQFQLWLLRKEEPKIVSAGSFNIDDQSQVVIEFDNPSVISDISSLAITDEPEGGSETPTGNKILETASTAPVE